MTDVMVAEPIDKAKVLAALGFNAADPKAQAALLICQRYGLDPVLKHVVLIERNPYITRDGYLHIAHESGQLDGITIVEQPTLDGEYWNATVAVYRKDMAHPFQYVGRFPHLTRKGTPHQYGPEMAVKCAEVASLRRAFNITGMGAADERWDVDTEQEVAVYDGPLPTPAPIAVAEGNGYDLARQIADTEDVAIVDDADPVITPEQQGDFWRRIGDANLGGRYRNERDTGIFKGWKIPWNVSQAAQVTAWIEQEIAKDEEPF